MRWSIIVHAEDFYIIIIMLQYIRYLDYLKVTLLVSGIYIFGILEILLIFSFMWDGQLMIFMMVCSQDLIFESI